jgi:hypothetical protein
MGNGGFALGGPAMRWVAPGGSSGIAGCYLGFVYFTV